VALSAEDAAIYNEKGIDIPAATAYYEGRHGHLAGFDGGQTISNDDLLTCKCDILIPAAIEHVLTERNAGKVQAKVIVELANGPSTPEADRIFRERDILVVPDILANAGGVTVSYFEAVQNSYNYQWSLDEVRRHLDERMTHAFRSIHATAVEHAVDHRTAAYMAAISRVAEACRLRGWV
jgi:glutamate dehydrogenase/leucine dehydrogenase